MIGDEQATGWTFDRRTALKVGLGFGVAVVLVYLLGTAIGWDRTMAHLRAAELEWVGLAVLSTVLCLVAWGKTWQVVLGALGISVPFRKLLVTFFAATFANYVTPMGQAGGEPFIAYLLSRDTSATYEQSLASVMTTDLLRLLPFFNVGIVGLGYLVVETRLPGRTERFAVVLVGLAVGLPALLAVAWHRRETVRRGVLRLAEPLAMRTGRVTVAGVDERIDELYASIGLIVDSPRELAVAVVLSYVGWILFALPLYFSGLALDVPIPLLLVAFLVPVTVIAGSTPSPGGLAVIEGTLVALLTTLVAMSTDVALAVTTLYRLASYWFVVGAGGIAALWVLARA